MKIAIRSLSLSFLITLSTSSLAMASGLDNAAPERLSSIHAQDAALHRDVQPLLLRDGFLQSLKPAPKTAQKTATQSFTKTVFGYLPFWMEDGAQIPWEHLTHLSYFSAEASSAGNITNSHGWTSGGAALVATGKSHGVKVVLTVTIFGNAAVGELLGSTIAMDNLITNLLDLVQDAGGEGVNVDFEYVPATHKNEFVTFMTDLTEAFHSAVPGSHVSLASPAVDWSGAYDYDELAIHTDGLMIMGYDYHWSTSDPGPVAPIETGDFWGGRNLTTTVEEYLLYGGEENRDKFVLGFPLYGRDWPSVDATVPGEMIAGGSSVARLVHDCDTDFLAGKSWDMISQTPYQIYEEGTQTHQLWCEDLESLEAKLNLALDNDMGGVMFWALGYAGLNHPLWEATDLRFTGSDSDTGGNPDGGCAATFSALAGLWMGLWALWTLLGRRRR